MPFRRSQRTQLREDGEWGEVHSSQQSFHLEVSPSEWITNTVNDLKYRPITAALIIGSVGVKHAEMTSEDTRSSFGKSTWMNACGKERKKGNEA